jgi:hypothetical protein
MASDKSLTLKKGDVWTFKEKGSDDVEMQYLLVLSEPHAYMTGLAFDALHLTGAAAPAGTVDERCWWPHHDNAWDKLA